MSASITCDNCDLSVPGSYENTMNWIRLGWNDSQTQDACSVPCARDLLDGLQQQLQDWIDSQPEEPTDPMAATS